MLTVNHKGDFVFEIPDKWVSEDNGDTTSIYFNDGNGALTLSYFTIIEMKETLDEHISIMAK